MSRAPSSNAGGLNRRRWLQQTVCGAAASAAWTSAAPSSAISAETRAHRIRQSIVFWCFHAAGEKWDITKTCRVANQLGCVSVELVSPTHWPTLKKHNLVCAIASNGMPGPAFMRGFNNPAYHEQVIHHTQQTIDACAAAGFPSVIAFTGYKWRDAENPKSGEISAEEGADNCVAGLKKIAGYAEQKGVTICVEHLNTRDDSHPMKGHPGYQGDNLDYVAEIIRRVGSPRVKLLFDIYHVQVMHGDLIRRLEQCRDILGHVHTAGCPGRGELDEQQEISYPAVMRKLLDLNFDGYVGQEFIPTGDPLAGLRQAVTLCDV